MRAFLFIASTLAVVLAVSAKPSYNDYPHIDNFDEAGECVPNQVFYDKCNRCNCSPDGKSAACTLKACLDYETIRIDNYVTGQKCPAGQQFFDKCNTCKCSESGLSAGCTRMACPGYEKITARTARSAVADYPHIDNFDEAGECVPNQVFYNQCNRCHCSPDGKSAACTLKACQTPKTIRIDNYVQGQKCPAGQQFFDKCNTCKCSASGLAAGCTRKACPGYEKITARTRRSVDVDYPHIDNFNEARECVPNQIFYNKCNRCTCTANGKSAICTLIGCLNYDTIRIDNYVAGQKCPAGKTFYDKCNTCVCDPSGTSAACTVMACLDEVVPATRTRRSAESDLPHIDNFDEAGECVPNQVFYNQCNRCHCSPDGKSAACTLKACQTPETIRIDNYVEGQKCPAGQQFFDKCNTCKCSASGVSAACTLKECNFVPATRTRRSAVPKFPHIDNFDEAGECVPSENFYNKCNVCRCSPSGKSASCTLMECGDYNTIRIDNYTNGKKCPAGKQFYDQCNTCVCGANGLSAICTLAACLE